MTKKQKALLVLVALASVIAVVAIIVIKKQAPESKALVQSQETQQIESERLQSTSKEISQNSLPKEIKGKIVGITPTSIIIDQETGALTATFDLNSTPVFKRLNKIRASALDLKAGINVIAIIDQATNSAIEIILQ